MKIAIVSDSHGNASRLRAAIAALKRHGAEIVVHCGDIGSTECVAALAESSLPAYAVLGNVDRGAQTLADEARASGVELAWEAVEVPIGDGRTLVATHGHDAAVLNQLICSKQFPYVCHGHTHCVRDERVGGVRVINPGSLVRSRNPSHPTAALLDTETDELEFFEGF